ncbi:HTH domain-containing protein [Candidatus Micrarchaeota archaeon]|nr:HTH domain-containing protein [Candidatus Micrarchaeota archaeon]
MYFSGAPASEKQDIGNVETGTSCRKGRPAALSGEKLEKLLELYYTKPYSLREIADILRVSRMTVWRAVQALHAA